MNEDNKAVKSETETHTSFPRISFTLKQFKLSPSHVAGQSQWNDFCINILKMKNKNTMRYETITSRLEDKASFIIEEDDNNYY